LDTNKRLEQNITQKQHITQVNKYLKEQAERKRRMEEDSQATREAGDDLADEDQEEVPYQR